MTTVARLDPTPQQTAQDIAALHVVMLMTGRCVVIAEGTDAMLATSCGPDGGGFTVGTIVRACERLVQQRQQRADRRAIETATDSPPTVAQH